MNHFSSALTTWLETDQKSLSLRQLSQLAGLNHGDISRIRSGVKRITFESAAKLLPAIARHFGRPSAETLLVAYLRDEIPPEFQDSITIQASTAGTLILPEGPIAAALRWIHDRSGLDPEFAAWIVEMHALMSPAVQAFQIEPDISGHRDPEPAGTWKITELLTQETFDAARAADAPPI